MAQVAPALRLCKHQINILATLSPLTLSSSINIFFAFRILQTRMMILYTLHCPNFNSKLGALLRGATCTRHLYGTTIASHQQCSRCFFEPCDLVQFTSDFPMFLITNLFSILDLLQIIPWKENILGFENSNKFMRATLFSLNSPFDIGHIVAISFLMVTCSYLYS